MNDASHALIPPAGGTGLNQRLLSSLKALSRVSSCVIAVVGLAVLLGWQFDIELLRAGLPGGTPVNPATALALLLGACALWMHHQAGGSPDSAPARWVAVTAASLVIALGVITLAGYFIGHNLLVDQLLFGSELAGNRVAPNTGFALLLIGVALWLLNSPRGSRRALEQVVGRCSRSGSPSSRCSATATVRRECTDSAKCNAWRCRRRRLSSCWGSASSALAPTSGSFP